MFTPSKTVSYATSTNSPYSLRFSDLSVVYFFFFNFVHSRFCCTCLRYGKFYDVLFTFQVVFMRNFESCFAKWSILQRRLFAMNSPRFAAFTPCLPIYNIRLTGVFFLNVFSSTQRYSFEILFVYNYILTNTKNIIVLY